MEELTDHGDLGSVLVQQRERPQRIASLDDPTDTLHPQQRDVSNAVPQVCHPSLRMPTSSTTHDHNRCHPSHGVTIKTIPGPSQPLTP
jgi:hypothetical protein